MLPQLTAVEARLIGCLMEKSVVTPDQYPLTLNALTNACNQKSAREPVMALTPSEVQRAARALNKKSLLHIDENFKTGKEKYKQRLCNTQFNELQFDAAQFAVICLMLLRGAQTPGELRARGERLHRFTDNAAVVAALDGLIGEHGDEAVVVKLPRTPGRRDSEYMHRLCGPIDTPPEKIATRKSAGSAASEAEGAEHGQVATLMRRVRELEAEVARLEAELATHGR